MAAHTVINALPAGTVIGYTWENQRFTLTKREDGRWTGRYTLDSGALCANGLWNARAVARNIDSKNVTSVTFN